MDQSNILDNIDKFLDLLPYSIFMKDTEGRLIYSNKQGAVSSLKPVHEILGKTDEEIWGKEIGEKYREEDKKLDETQKSIIIDEKATFFGEVCDVATYYKMNVFDSCNQNIGMAGFIVETMLEWGTSKVIESMQNRLNEINTMLGSTEEHIKTPQLLMDMQIDILDRLRADLICIVLHDRFSQSFSVHNQWGINEETVTRINRLMKKCKIGNLKDLENYDLLGMKKSKEIRWREYREILIEKGFSYTGIYPIFFCNEFIGFLWIGYRSDELLFDIQDGFINNLCAEIGMTIKNAMLFNEIESKIQAIISREQELRQFFDSCGDLLFELNQEAEGAILGGQWERIFGWNRHEITERLFSTDYCQDMYDVLEEDFSKGNHNLFYEHQIPCKNGEVKTIFWNIGQNKEKNSYTMIGRDITSKKQDEKKNEDLQRRIEIEKIKNEFLSHVSKQFKAPIDTIISGVQLLDKEIVEDNIVQVEGVNFDKHLAIVKQNSYRLLRLINNIIDMTHISQGSCQLNLDIDNIVSVVEDIVLSTIDYVESKGISLIFDTDREERIMAFDIDKVERIVLNIMSNAIKYTKENGTIQVRIKNEENHVMIAIKDNGIGIEQDKLKCIFDRFNQVDNVLTRKREGSGIGLALVKSLVELHKGSVTVKSKIGKGSEFIVKLPTQLCPDKNQIDKMSSYLDTHIERYSIEFSDIYN